MAASSLHNRFLIGALYRRPPKKSDTSNPALFFFLNDSPSPDILFSKMTPFSILICPKTPPTLRRHASLPALSNSPSSRVQCDRWAWLDLSDGASHLASSRSRSDQSTVDFQSENGDHLPSMTSTAATTPPVLSSKSSTNLTALSQRLVMFLSLKIFSFSDSGIFLYLSFSDVS